MIGFCHDVMALAQDIKKGGPYTKEEKEERRNQVYKMHFEQGKPAVKIAETLGVNRNTVGDDIKYWYSQISKETGGTNYSLNIISIIHGYELQRSRLLDDLEKTENFEDRIRIERLLFDINNKLGQLVTKLMTSEKTISAHYDEGLEDDEIKEVKEFVRYLIFDIRKYVATQDEIKKDYIRKSGSNKHKADTISEDMWRLGLNECLIPVEWNEINQKNEYDIVEFASMCEFITLDELALVRKSHR
jgi:hypothetical protein